MTESTNVSSLDFKLDLSQKAKESKFEQQRKPNKFEYLCDNVESCLKLHSNCLDEIYNFKDEIMKHHLPSSLLLQLTLLSSRVFRSCTDVDTVIRELLRLVRQYSVTWEEKSAVLLKIRNDYERKQRQLSIAVKKLESLAIKAEQVEHERRINNWMKLYSKVMSTKSIGRRWKFRIEPFKRKLSEGYNPYLSEESGSSSDDEEQKSIEASEEELKELTSELSQILPTSSRSDSKRVQFDVLEDIDQYMLSSPVVQSSPVQSAVEKYDASSWTDEPNYDHHLLLILYRPKGILKDKDIVCTVSLEDEFFTSEVYKPLTDDDDSTDDSYQTFHLTMSNNVSSFLMTSDHKPDDVLLTPKLNIAVFPRSIADDVVAHCSIPIPEISLNDDPMIIVPPDTDYTIKEDDNEDNRIDENDKVNEDHKVIEDDKEDEQSEVWSPDWSNILLDVLTCNPNGVVYPLKLTKEDDEELDNDDTTPSLLMICQLIKIQQHRMFHKATCTKPWDKLMNEMGYKQSLDTQSVGISAVNLLPTRSPSPDKPSTPVAVEDTMTMNEVAQLTLKHTEDLKLLQKQYEEKLESLSKMLSKVKSEKQKQINELEQALMESEARKGKKFKSPTEMRQLMEQKRKFTKATQGLPQWGKDWPEDFFERMELFASENLRKHSELTERIKHEVQETCEQQLAALNRLALSTNVDTALKDVSLPAVFMPTSTSRHIVYNPRAHSYFHSFGSKHIRVSQPPSIFKLPPVDHQQHLSTVNLYELSQDFSQMGPHWLRSDTPYHTSPRLTPAPPPSACDNYTILVDNK